MGHVRGPRRSKAKWQEIARDYIEGPGDGYKLLAREHKVSLRHLKRRGKAEGWAAQRIAYLAHLRAQALGLDTPIAANEPTWTFRAGDQGAALAIRKWANERDLYGGADPARTEAARLIADAMDQWRKQRRRAS
jgi:hypothetical protein